MLIILGIVAVIISIATFILPVFSDEVANTTFGKMATKIKFGIFVLGLILMIAGKSLLYSEPGYQYFIVDPFGNKSAIISEGYKFIVPFSKTSE